jgi:glycosyltransferase involved in cell wall biosynthesis
MQYVKAALGADLSALGAPCVYDAEAVYALRDIGRRRLGGEGVPPTDEQALVAAELALTRGCSAVLVVNTIERELFAAAGVSSVCVVGHSSAASTTSNGFERRRTILFVGAFGADSPNDDAVRFLCREILPALRTAGCDAPIVIAGARIPDAVKEFGDATISCLSDVDDLTPLYDEARVFVAPTRYGAGIPLKVIDAVAHGLPVVATTLIARQLGWTPNADLLTADDQVEFGRAVATLYADPRLWTCVREAALRRVLAEHSPVVFHAAVRDALHRATSTERSG